MKSDISTIDVKRCITKRTLFYNMISSVKTKGIEKPLSIKAENIKSLMKSFN